MKNIILKTTAAAAALMALTGIAAADVTAVAVTDLNIRSGPGPQYPIVGAIGANQEAVIGGCQEGSKWCVVSYNGVDGWAYSDYLTAPFGGERVVLTERPSEALPPVSYEATSSVRTEVVHGELIGRKTALGTIEPIPAPPAEIRTYVEAHSAEPVYLDGEVVVGAALPDTVEVREIPDYQYRYVYVNQQPVLVEPETRRIVYVLR
ncbi:DUF1236 domain-containing protein [Nitratireductor indicus]|uniref:SH3b domain-containing protein n=1 Tax=Nitratireductor indicus C115 TaxID=1231190 RepID=K2NV86_9HYPH|nr:DUF1236 domain-containing protein [Nitratireductor indicus]EKF41759.1 hypothetical protein NA8A_14119 [Nitratireductor indicus C115]MDS1136960.1 DUF1236 domain-containing protein [Nitratireductor indicus]SFQ67627.1 Uncharacterized conserved protein YraI [Nitratireductor indicus]